MVTVNHLAIVKAMVDSNIGVYALAKKSGISVGRVVQIARDNVKIRVQTLRRLAIALNVSPFELMVEKVVGEFKDGYNIGYCTSARNFEGVDGVQC